MIKLMLYFLIALFMVIFGLVFKYENLVDTDRGSGGFGHTGK